MAAPRYWMARLIVPLEILVCVVVVSWFEKASLTAQAIEHTGGFGWVLLLALGGCCMLGIADVAFNDVMHKSGALFEVARDMRHIGFMAMAILLAAIGVLVAFTTGYTSLLLVYWLNAALAGGITFLDAFARIRKC